MLLERLQGLGLIVVGCIAMLLVYLAQQHGWLQVRPPAPAGLENVPVITPLSCILPMAGLGAVGLCFAGLRKLVAPDNWSPPKHLDSVSRETIPPVPRRPRRRASALHRLLRRLLERSR